MVEYESHIQPEFTHVYLPRIEWQNYKHKKGQQNCVNKKKQKGGGEGGTWACQAPDGTMNLGADLEIIF